MATRNFPDRRNFLRALLGVAAAAAVAIPASKVEAASPLVDPDLPAQGAVEVQARDLRPSDSRPTERRGDSLALPPDGAARAGSRRGRRITRRNARRTRRRDRRMARSARRARRRE